MVQITDSTFTQVILHITYYVIQCVVCIDGMLSCVFTGSVPLQVVVADALPDGPLGECITCMC